MDDLFFIILELTDTNIIIPKKLINSKALYYNSSINLLLSSKTHTEQNSKPLLDGNNKSFGMKQHQQQHQRKTNNKERYSNIFNKTVFFVQQKYYK